MNGAYIFIYQWITGGVARKAREKRVTLKGILLLCAAARFQWKNIAYRRPWRHRVCIRCKSLSLTSAFAFAANKKRTREKWREKRTGDTAQAKRKVIGKMERNTKLSFVMSKSIVLAVSPRRSRVFDIEKWKELPSHWHPMSVARRFYPGEKHVVSNATPRRRERRGRETATLSTLQRLVLRGIPKPCRRWQRPAYLSLLSRLHGGWPHGGLFRSRNQPRQILSTRYLFATARLIARVNKKKCPSSNCRSIFRTLIVRKQNLIKFSIWEYLFSLLYTRKFQRNIFDYYRNDN